MGAHNGPTFIDRTPRQASRLALPWWQAFLAAATGGFLLDVSLPDIGWWPAALIGAVLVLSAIWQQRPWLGFGIGAVAGASFWFPQISWLTLYLGPIPWLALGTLMTLGYAVMGAVLGPVTRGLSRLPIISGLIVVIQVLAAAGIWTARELAQSSWPYGGFAWGRLAHTQSSGPLAELVSWLGFAGLSGVLAAICAIPVAAFFARRISVRDRVRRTLSLTDIRRAELRQSASWRPFIQATGATLVVLTLLALVPIAQTPQTGTVRIAAVQGNSDAGIFDDRESGDVLKDHVSATSEYLSDVEEGKAGSPPDLIVWPENSAEFDFAGSVYSRGLVDGLARRADAPIVVGSILPPETNVTSTGDATVDAAPMYTNSSLVWQPARGITGRYDKRYPVPFAEYMPNRSFFRALVPDLVDLVQLEYGPGTRPSAMPIDLGDPATDPFIAGLAICFDIIFDEQAVAMIDNGAEIILAQTNNADFGRTDENAQQLEIARLRAIEMGRAVVNISTVGISEIIGPDGRALDSIEPYTSGVMVANVPRLTGRTPALEFGASIAALWLVLGAAGSLLAIAGARLQRHLN
jgi:apolipoprotein N-acyltransferase